MELLLGVVAFLVASSMVVACWRSVGAVAGGAADRARGRVGGARLVAVLREPLALWVLCLGPDVVIAVGRLAVEWWRQGSRHPERLAGE
ncbi:hypothetical protein ABZU76_43755 [Amycolatopsis sp. NPDC005232]|uniref:hypothetical protein n=1 Tax=Amycolatopsis sp. NPDC005232 TaxID=3157027 RepID=UPI0033BCE437